MLLVELDLSCAASSVVQVKNEVIEKFRADHAAREAPEPEDDGGVEGGHSVASCVCPRGSIESYLARSPSDVAGSPSLQYFGFKELWSSPPPFPCVVVPLAPLRVRTWQRLRGGGERCREVCSPLFRSVKHALGRCPYTVERLFSRHE